MEFKYYFIGLKKMKKKEKKDLILFLMIILFCLIFNKNAIAKSIKEPSLNVINDSYTGGVSDSLFLWNPLSYNLDIVTSQINSSFITKYFNIQNNKLNSTCKFISLKRNEINIPDSISPSVLYILNNDIVEGYSILEPIVFVGLKKSDLVDKIEKLTLNEKYLFNKLTIPNNFTIKFYEKENKGFIERYCVVKGVHYTFIVLNSFYELSLESEVEIFNIEALNRLLKTLPD